MKCLSEGQDGRYSIDCIDYSFACLDSYLNLAILRGMQSLTLLLQGGQVSLAMVCSGSVLAESSCKLHQAWPQAHEPLHAGLHSQRQG